MIVINERTIGLWFLQITQTQDWLLGLEWVDDQSMKAGKGDINLVYRFRYYAEDGVDRKDPENIHNEKDTKNWYSGIVCSKKEEAIEKVRMIANKLKEGGAIGKVDELLYTGDPESFMKTFSNRPYMHVKKIEKTAEA
jgi:hypothetical protein